MLGRVATCTVVLIESALLASHTPCTVHLFSMSLHDQANLDGAFT